ncbi:MAG: hypothetical protein U0797_11370 [Gemmataceae bacterium]
MGGVTLGTGRRPVSTVLVGGPLAVLAMLFPAAFGGWTRWRPCCSPPARTPPC